MIISLFHKVKFNGKEICVTYGVHEMEYDIVKAYHSIDSRIDSSTSSLQSIIEKYKIESNIYIVGGYSTLPYEVVSKFPVGKFGSIKDTV